MTNQKEAKLKRLTVNKETIQDLDVPHAEHVKAGGKTWDDKTIPLSDTCSYGCCQMGTVQIAPVIVPKR